MVNIASLTVKEIKKHIAWLESEIDKCLSYDLPVGHFEKELIILKEVIHAQKFSN